MRRFAQGTTVPADRSRSEIEKLLQRYGAREFAYGYSDNGAFVGFSAKGRKILFQLPIPKADGTTPTQRDRHAQEVRRLWRALVLSIKAKLEVVQSGITSFEHEFLAYIVLPGAGTTVGNAIAPQLAEAYKSGAAVPLLPSSTNERP